MANVGIESPLTIPEMETAYLAGLSVLIVDDEVLLRKAMAAGLERLGADVVVVGNLAAARQMTRELSLDLVLLDVHLPDGLGTELLKEKAFQDGTSVIVMTAHGAVAGAVEAMRLGASDYLVKPVDAGELPLVVHRVIRARQSARAREHQRADDLQSGQAFFFGSALAALQQQLEKILAADRRVWLIVDRSIQASAPTSCGWCPRAPVAQRHDARPPFGPQTNRDYRPAGCRLGAGSVPATPFSRFLSRQENLGAGEGGVTVDQAPSGDRSEPHHSQGPGLSNSGGSQRRICGLRGGQS